MNKLFFCLLLAGSPSLVFAQTNGNITITGRVKEIEVQEVYLSYPAQEGFVTDSARVVDHRYTLSGHVEKGLVAMLTTAGPSDLPTPDKTISLFLLPAEHVDITHTRTFSNAAITGSPANTEYGKILELEKPGTDQKAALENYMTSNPSSPLLTFAFNDYVGDPRSLRAEDVPKVRSLFNLLPDSIRSLPNSKLFEQQMDKLITFDKVAAVGQPAPDFTQNDTAGHPVSLSSFRGKYVLLDFWASWCGPCREENPTVVAAYAKYHSKGFEILGVSLDQKADSWKKAIRADKLGWTHVSDLKYWDNALVRLYGVQGVPQNFLIDPQGKIIARGLRGQDLEKRLEEIYSR